MDYIKYTPPFSKEILCQWYTSFLLAEIVLVSIRRILTFKIQPLLGVIRMSGNFHMLNFLRTNELNIKR